MHRKIRQVLSLTVRADEIDAFHQRDTIPPTVLLVAYVCFPQRFHQIAGSNQLISC